MGLFGFGKKNKQGRESTFEEQEQESVKEQDISFQAGDMIFEIGSVHPWKEQGSILVGKMMSGELLPGTKISYLGQNGRRIFDCTVETIEQNGHAVKKASACWLGIYGPVFSLIIKDFAPNAFQGGNQLVRRIETGEETSPVLTAYEDCRMTKEQEGAVRAVIGKDSLEEEELKELSIQEIIFALACTRDQSNLCKDDAEQAAKWKEKGDKLYPCLLEKIKTADAVYLTFDKNTGFPFYNNGIVEVYSKRQYAELAVLYYKEQFRELEVHELSVKPETESSKEPDKRIPAFAMLYYLGMERVLVDNGMYRALIGRGDILPPPDYSGLPQTQVPVSNPVLRARMLDFFGEARWKVNYEKRAEVLQAKELAMLSELTNSKLLIPMRYDGTAQKKPGENQIVFTKDTKLMFAVITNAAGENYTPVFTDFTEFGKVYPAKDWGAAVVTIADAIRVNQGVGISVNPTGENLVLKEKAIEAIKGILAQKAKESSGTEA